jgi:hypothetical protein
MQSPSLPVQIPTTSRTTNAEHNSDEAKNEKKKKYG